jgi:hypothetical protein
MKPAPHEISEERQTLWLLTVSPTIWAVHFLLSYIGAAVWCGKFAGRDAGLGTIRTVIVVLALVALAGITLAGWRGWKKHSYGHGASQPPHDQDTPEDRHRFLGFATVLLSALSAVATIYVTMSTFFIGSCA